MNLVIRIGGNVYASASYNRQAALDKPGATWSAFFESCDEDLWSGVEIEEDGERVLTGYLLSRTYEHKGVQVTGSDTYIRAHDTMVETDLETEIEYTAYDYAEYLLGLAGLSHSITENLRNQGVEPGIQLGPGSVHEALMSVIKYAGVFVWVDAPGVVHIDELPNILGETYDGFMRHERELSDETTRHTIKVYGFNSGSPLYERIFGLAEGDLLGDPVARIGVISSPHIMSSDAAQAIALAAVEHYGSHDDVRTITLDGFRPNLSVPIMLLDDDSVAKHITQLDSSVDESGATTTVTLDRRGKMFQYEYSDWYDWQDDEESWIVVTVRDFLLPIGRQMRYVSSMSDEYYTGGSDLPESPDYKDHYVYLDKRNPTSFWCTVNNKLYKNTSPKSVPGSWSAIIDGVGVFRDKVESMGWSVGDYFSFPYVMFFEPSKSRVWFTFDFMEAETEDIYGVWGYTDNYFSSFDLVVFDTQLRPAYVTHAPANSGVWVRYMSNVYPYAYEVATIGVNGMTRIPSADGVQFLGIPLGRWNSLDRYQFGIRLDLPGYESGALLRTSNKWLSYTNETPSYEIPENFYLMEVSPRWDGSNDIAIVYRLSGSYERWQRVYIRHNNVWRGPLETYSGSHVFQYSNLQWDHGTGRVYYATVYSPIDGRQVLIRYTDDYGATWSDGPLWTESPPGDRVVSSEKTAPSGIYTKV